MSCKGCGDKQTTRHGASRVSGDVDGEGASPFINPDGSQAYTDPLAAMIAAKKMSYEELTQRREFQQRMIKRQSEAIMSEMTDVMRRVHVDELVSVANCETFSLPGMTPQQAIVVLKETLDREEFSFIRGIYPGLYEAVCDKYAEFRKSLLPGRKST